MHDVLDDPPPHSSDITELRGILHALDQWRTAEVLMQARGAHRKPDGSWFFQVEYLVEVTVPDREQVSRLMDLVDGRPVDVIEAHPVTTGEAVSLPFSDASETQAGDPSASNGEVGVADLLGELAGSEQDQG
jgi:hypothetical protein